MKDAVASGQRNREFCSAVGQHLTRLHRFVRHELACFEAVGDLVPGELTPEDVVDAVVLRAYWEFVNDPATREIKQSRLLRQAIKYLEVEVRGSSPDGHRAAPVENGCTGTSPHLRVVTPGHEILDFYEPREHLKFESVLPDVDAASVEEAETPELRQCLNEALARMPRDCRRALLLRQVEDLSGAEIAGALGVSVRAVEWLLQRARQHLRQTVLDSRSRVDVDDTDRR